MQGGRSRVDMLGAGGGAILPGACGPTQEVIVLKTEVDEGGWGYSYLVVTIQGYTSATEESNGVHLEVKKGCIFLEKKGCMEGRGDPGRGAGGTGADRTVT
eukprot:765725-Hanusia_phi.AAC.3